MPRSPATRAWLARCHTAPICGWMKPRTAGLTDCPFYVATMGRRGNQVNPESKLGDMVSSFSPGAVSRLWMGLSDTLISVRQFGPKRLPIPYTYAIVSGFNTSGSCRHARSQLKPGRDMPSISSECLWIWISGRSARA